MQIDFLQYGALGLAAFLAWILWKVITNHEKHFIDICQEQTRATKENTKALTQLQGIIQRDNPKS